MKRTSQSLDVLDVKSLIHEHSLFFDKLVELIPARFYLPVEDTETKWFRGLSKEAKVSAKKKTKENVKKARRARLDPEKALTTLELLKKSLETKEDGSTDEENEQEDNKKSTSGMDDKSVTYEQLRQKLHRRIEELRGNRNAGPADKVLNNKKKDKTRDLQQGKRKRAEEEKEAKDDNSSAKMEGSGVAGKDNLKSDLKFGHVKLGRGEETSHRKKRKLSKLQELEKVKKLEEAKKDPEKGGLVSKKHSWSAAASRAAGVKVHDDPKPLKESMKKDKKRHEKNVEKWKERLQTTQNAKAVKQESRAANIAQRAEDKKMRKIAKREKKLMRPGFEGRKEGFINES